MYTSTEILESDHLWALFQSKSDRSCIWGHQCCLGIFAIDLTAPIGLAVSDVRDKKARVIAIFGFGLFACIASILRLLYSSELIQVPSNNPAYQIDLDRLGLWAFAEIAIGIIVGCLPVLPKFSKHFASKRAGLSSRLYSLSSTGPSSWRRLFRKSATPEGSRYDTPQSHRKFSSSRKASRSTGAPHIETLNLTRISLQFDGIEIPAAVLRNTTTSIERDGHRVDRRIVDIEEAIPPGW